MSRKIQWKSQIAEIYSVPCLSIDVPDRDESSANSVLGDIGSSAIAELSHTSGPNSITQKENIETRSVSQDNKSELSAAFNNTEDLSTSQKSRRSLCPAYGRDVRTSTTLDDVHNLAKDKDWRSIYQKKTKSVTEAPLVTSTGEEATHSSVYQQRIRNIIPNSMLSAFGSSIQSVSTRLDMGTGINHAALHNSSGSIVTAGAGAFQRVSSALRTFVFSVWDSFANPRRTLHALFHFPARWLATYLDER